MLIVRRLKLITPLLASKRKDNWQPGEPERVFNRWRGLPTGETDTSRTYLCSDLPRWEWAFLEARDELKLTDVATSCIIPCRWYSVKRTSSYSRKFSRGGKMCSEKFEALPSGQVIEMKFTLSRHVPPGTDGNGRFTRAPDDEEFDGMLAHIGVQLGMSEWGHAREYGRFEIKVNTLDEPTPEITPGGDREDGDELED